MDTVLSDEDDDGCYGSDAYDDPEGSDWSDCELSDELGPRLGVALTSNG